MSIEPVVKPRAGNRKIVLTSYVLKKGFHIIFRPLIKPVVKAAVETAVEVVTTGLLRLHFV